MKTCTSCGKEKLLCEFYRASARHDHYRGECKECFKNKIRCTRKPDKRTTRKRSTKARYVKRYALIHTLKSVPCADCHNTFPVYCMEFDHVPERGAKLCNVPMLWHCSEQTFLAEVAKCDVVCSNCHRIRTRTRHDVSGV